MSREKATRWINNAWIVNAWHVAWDRRGYSDRIVKNNPLQEIQELISEEKKYLANKISLIIDGEQKIIPLPFEQRFAQRSWLWD